MEPNRPRSRDKNVTSGGSGVGRSDTALHKNVSGNVKWAKGMQINRPDETAIRRMLENAQ